MKLVDVSPRVESLAWEYVGRFSLPHERILLTERRKQFELWVGRRVSGSVGGAYAYLRPSGEHAVLINVARIDTSRQRALEIVVCEELLHMRDWLAGDRRRHAKHGYDRIAHEVSQQTGATLDEIRSCLRPVRRREYRYVYQCPGCRREILRKKRGVWSCGHCSPRFSATFELVLTREVNAAAPKESPMGFER
ncbi:hypothetical protein BH23CHL5_BH23CHL5_16520 [soil metagenome]